jgi:hypothetical protein
MEISCNLSTACRMGKLLIEALQTERPLSGQEYTRECARVSLFKNDIAHFFCRPQCAA